MRAWISGSDPLVLGAETVELVTRFHVRILSFRPVRRPAYSLLVGQKGGLKVPWWEAPGSEARHGQRELRVKRLQPTLAFGVLEQRS